MDRVFSCLQQVTKMAHPCQNTPFAQANAAITNEVISTFFFFFLKQETHTHTPAKASDVRGDTHIKKKRKEGRKVCCGFVNVNSGGLSRVFLHARKKEKKKKREKKPLQPSHVPQVPLSSLFFLLLKVATACMVK